MVNSQPCKSFLNRPKKAHWSTARVFPSPTYRFSQYSSGKTNTVQSPRRRVSSFSVVEKQTVFFLLRLGFKSLGKNNWNQKIVPLDCKVCLFGHNSEIPLLKEPKISDFC